MAAHDLLHPRTTRRACLLMLAAPAMAAVAQPTRWPERPVRYVVPYAAGGPTDAVGRLVAHELAQRWQQQVVVDNRPGANANIGADFVAKSPPDGCTLLQGTSSTHGTNPVLFARLPYNAQRDFVPVVTLVEGPVYLCVSTESRYQTLADLVAYARAHPGKVNFGTAGPGSPQHLAGELLANKAGLELVAVHYRGAAPALLALQRGEIDLYFDSAGAAHARSGRARVLGVSTRWRWPLSPEIPTLVEGGIADFEIHGWFALFAPAGTPPAVVERINADANAVLALPSVRQGIEAMGLRPLGGTPADLQQRVQRETRYWAELVRASNITVD